MEKIAIYKQQISEFVNFLSNLFYNLFKSCLDLIILNTYIKIFLFILIFVLFAISIFGNRARNTNNSSGMNNTEEGGGDSNRPQPSDLLRVGAEEELLRRIYRQSRFTERDKYMIIQDCKKRIETATGQDLAKCLHLKNLIMDKRGDQAITSFIRNTRFSTFREMYGSVTPRPMPSIAISSNVPMPSIVTRSNVPNITSSLRPSIPYKPLTPLNYGNSINATYPGFSQSFMQPLTNTQSIKPTYPGFSNGIMQPFGWK